MGLKRLLLYSINNRGLKALILNTIKANITIKNSITTKANIMIKKSNTKQNRPMKSKEQTFEAHNIDGPEPFTIVNNETFTETSTGSPMRLVTLLLLHLHQLYSERRRLSRYGNSGDL